MDMKMNELARVGFVVSRQPEKHRVRVEFRDTVTAKLVSGWLPVLVPRASADMAFDLPDVGDQVLCLFLGNGLEEGFVLGSMYGAQTPPVSSGDKFHRTFSDGTTLEYDRAAHKLRASVRGDVEASVTGNVEVTLQGSGKVTAGGALAFLELEPEASVCTTLSHGLLIRYIRSWIWGYSRWSDLYPPSSGFVHGQLGTHPVEREDRPWLFRGRRVAREQLVWSGADMAVPVGQWGDINCRWSKGVFLLFRSMRWGSSRWSGCGRRLVTTLERRLAPGRALARYAGQPVCLPGTVQAHAVRIELYPNNIWLGAWDSRLWNPTPPVPHRSTATRLPRLRWSSPACGWGKAVW